MSTKVILQSVLAPGISCNPGDLIHQFVGIGQLPLHAVRTETLYHLARSV